MDEVHIELAHSVDLVIEYLTCLNDIVTLIINVFTNFTTSN